MKLQLLIPRRVFIASLFLFSVSLQAQVPVTGAIPPVDMEPAIQKYSYEYGEVPFDPVHAGFDNLTFIGYLPYRKSIDVEASPLGIGYEVLDREKYDYEKTIPVMKNSGVKWARLQSGWNKTEQIKGVYNFAWLDEIVNDLLEAGIQPWLSVSYGNALYTPEENPKEGYISNVPLHYGSEAVLGWKNYVLALAEHFKGRITHWEVWNEPNAGFWGPNPDPVEYVELVKITSEQIRRHIPGAKIIGGAISGGSNCNQYIRAVAAHHIADFIDIFSYHPYGLLPEADIEQRLEYMKYIFAGNGKKIVFWQGECGRPSASVSKGRGYKLTTANQAVYLTRRILTDLRIGFEMTSYFLVADLNNYGGNTPGGYHHQGIIETVNYTPKPAFYALQSMAYLFDSQTRYTDYACIEADSDIPYRLGSNGDYRTITAGFMRGNIPIYSYYVPENIDIDFGCKRARVSVWVEPDYRFENPVLIDPITRKVYKLRLNSGNIHRKNGNMYRFSPVPLLDYPLFITDVSLITGEKY